MRLLTAEQAAKQFGIPNPRTFRTMRQQGLKSARLGRAFLFDADDVEAFIEARKESHCPAPTKALTSTGSPVAAHGMSAGMSLESRGFDQLARTTSQRLKTRSPRSSPNSDVTGETGRVIRHNFS